MSGQVLGVDLGGTKLLMVCGDLVHRVATGPGFSPVDLESAVRTFLASLPFVPVGMGLAVPGLVKDQDRIVVCDVLPAMVGWSASASFADMDCRLMVFNDVSAALAEEMHDVVPGATAGLVMVGTAVGAAFLVEGLPLSGTSGWAGELGYMPMSVDGKVKRLDELAGGSFMAARRNVEAHHFAELARQGDWEALEIIREGGKYLGMALSSVINLFNPLRLAVGGGAMALPGYWEATCDIASRCSIPELWRDCKLYRTGENGLVVARGAARCVERLL